MIPLGVLGSKKLGNGPWVASDPTPGNGSTIDNVGWSGTRWWSNWSTSWFYSTDNTASFTATSSFTVTKSAAGGWYGGNMWLPGSLPGNGDWCMTTGAFDTVLKFYDDSAGTMNSITLGVSQIWCVPRYGNGLWVVAGHQANTATSTDGMTWTARGNPFYNGIHPVWSQDNSTWYGFSASGVAVKADPSDGGAWASATAVAPASPQNVFALNDGTGRFIMSSGGNLFEVYVDGTAVRTIASGSGYGAIVRTPTKLLAFPQGITPGTSYREMTLGSAGNIAFTTVSIGSGERPYLSGNAAMTASYGNGYVWLRNGTPVFSRRTQS